LNPSNGNLYGNLAHCLIALQHLEEARKTLAEAFAKGPDVDSNHEDLYAIAFLTHDSTTMAEQLAWLKRKPENDSLGLSMESDTEAYSGHLSKGRGLSRAAADSAAGKDKEAAATWWTNAAVRDALIGNAALARQEVDRALSLAPESKTVGNVAAFTLAVAED